MTSPAFNQKQTKCSPYAKKKIECTCSLLKSKREAMANKKRVDVNEGEMVLVKDNIYKIPYRRKNGMPANKYFIKTNCCMCGAEVFADRSNFQRNHRSVCSRGCQNKIIAAPDGTAKNKRGKNVLGGYIVIKNLNHPMAKKGWIPEHRSVVEQKIGRYLKPNEIIHHINMDKTDNRIENLHIFETHTEHCYSHGSLNKCVKHLIDSGTILFNEKDGTYLCK